MLSANDIKIKSQNFDTTITYDTVAFFADRQLFERHHMEVVKMAEDVSRTLQNAKYSLARLEFLRRVACGGRGGVTLTPESSEHLTHINNRLPTDFSHLFSLLLHFSYIFFLIFLSLVLKQLSLTFFFL